MAGWKHHTEAECESTSCLSGVSQRDVQCDTTLSPFPGHGITARLPAVLLHVAHRKKQSLRSLLHPPKRFWLESLKDLIEISLSTSCGAENQAMFTLCWNRFSIPVLLQPARGWPKLPAWRWQSNPASLSHHRREISVFSPKVFSIFEESTFLLTSLSPIITSLRPFDADATTNFKAQLKEKKPVAVHPTAHCIFKYQWPP